MIYYFRNVYNSLSDDEDEGHQSTALTQGSSYDCSDDVSTLTSAGKVLGNYQQWRNSRWKSLSDGNDGTIRCDQGNSKWLSCISI